MTLLVAALALMLAVTLLLLLLPLVRAGHVLQAFLAAAFITNGSVLLYVLWGSPLVVPQASAHHARVQELQEQIKVTSAIIKQHPDNLEAWLTLAQAFADSGDYAAAANGFKQAVLLSKGQPRIIMAYAEALIMQAEGAVTPAAKKSIDIALMIDPKLPLGRYYKAVWLLQNERQPEAMAMMKELYNELPESSSLKQRMKAQIGR